MGKIMKRVVLMLVLSISSIGANAYTLIADGDKALGILGLDVAGQSYDIEFVYDTYDNLQGNPGFLFLGDPNSARDLVEVVNDIFTNHDPSVKVPFIGGAGPEREAVFRIVYSETVTAVEWWGGWWGVRPYWEPLNEANLNNWATTYALITPVPIPTAVYLFGSALGLLGWMRRRYA
jgi:hypothetical protein